MFDTRKEALLSCMKTGNYTTYKLLESDLPVSGAFWIENGELVHRDLQKIIKFVDEKER